MKPIEPISAMRAVAALALLAFLAPMLAPDWGAAEAANVKPSYIVRAAAGSTEDPAMRPAMPAAVSFADGSNMQLPLGHFRGAVVLINFWATWCVPCVKEMGYIDRLQGDLKGMPLVVVAASEDKGGIPAAKAFLDRQKFTFLRPFADTGGQAAATLQVEGIPTSFIVDKHGRLIQRVEGPYAWDEPAIVNKFRGWLLEP